MTGPTGDRPTAEKPTRSLGIISAPDLQMIEEEEEEQVGTGTCEAVLRTGRSALTGAWRTLST